jgi:hypothetical protein
MAAYNLIATTTVGSGGAASIVFSGIPQTYTDLELVLSTRTGYASLFDDTQIQFNGASTNLTSRWVQGNGAAASSSNATSIFLFENAANSTASVFSNTKIYIPNYTSSNNKSVSIDNVTETNATTMYMRLIAGLWSNSAAITSITYNSAYSSTFAQYSSASLYGIKNS